VRTWRPPGDQNLGARGLEEFSEDTGAFVLDVHDHQGAQD